MPPAVALGVGSAVGGGASAAGGKKGQSEANKLAKQQLSLQQDLFKTGLSAFTPAKDYFSSLLSGDPTKLAEAVGPTRDILQQQAGANARQIAATAPAGGEQALAQANAQQDTYNSIARLTAGVQPQAATALGQLAGLPLQLGGPNAGAGLKGVQNAANQKTSKAGQVGAGLGQRLGSKGGGNPSWGQVFGKGARAPVAQPTFAPVPA